MEIPVTQKMPSILKQSRAKLWIRTGILAVFGTLFGLALYRDLASGKFHWPWILLTFLPCLAIGFWMSRLVPIQVHTAFQCVTLSFDFMYFFLILFLVVAKVITTRVKGMTFWADEIMCVILGLMIGRLSGICLRVHDLKIRNNFIIPGACRRKS